MYLRELPEPLMTIRLSNTFTTIFIDVPPQYRLRALQSAILLLPDENREVLQDKFLISVEPIRVVSRASCRQQRKIEYCQ